MSSFYTEINEEQAAHKKHVEELDRQAERFFNCFLAVLMVAAVSAGAIAVFVIMRLF